MKKYTIQNNKSGLTLVEVIVALTICLIVFFALMQTALVSIEANTANSLRDEAVAIAADRMNTARNTKFDSMLSDAIPLNDSACPPDFPGKDKDGNQRPQTGIIMQKPIKNSLDTRLKPMLKSTRFGTGY